MEHELGLRVQNYAMDFSAGPTIYEQIEAVARICACGVFLFTKDDPLEGRGGAAPRDNVVFEAGFFFRANGRGNELRSFEKRAPRCPLISAETSIFLSRIVPIFRQSIRSYDDSSKIQCDAWRVSSDQAKERSHPSGENHCEGDNNRWLAISRQPAASIAAVTALNDV
jgi:hypothetical protein